MLRRLRRVVLAWLCMLAGLALPAVAQDLVVALGEEVLTLPADGPTEPELQVTVFKPPGEGPFPVVVINHGRAKGDAKLQPRSRPLVAAAEFVRRGYAVVVPMRQGFAGSGGREITGDCNLTANGLRQARSVHRTLAWLATLPWADVSRNVVMGQSHGGLTTLAYGTQPHPGTRLLVNFAGGLRQERCAAWQDDLVAAIGRYGAHTRLPSLWFYGDNDSFFPPAVFTAAHERYVQAGGPAQLFDVGNFGHDAHSLFGSPAGLPIWWPRLSDALVKAGLPVAVLNPLPDLDDLPAPPATGYAALDDVDSVPVRNQRGRDGYKTWLAADGPKAFAIEPRSGVWAFIWGGLRPLAQSLERCERIAKKPCRLYAVDDRVVWSAE
jgi:dienelactone hydrolase